MVNLFKNHFSDSNLIQDSHNQPVYSWSNRESFFFAPITERELIEAGCGLKNKFSSGHDAVPVALLRRCIGVVAAPLCHIFNLSVQGGCFP